MIAELALPRLGETMETGRVVAWLKRPGERFTRGETLLEVESDKTVVEMPALADGTLLEILVPEGQDADVGAPLCRYEDGATATAAPVEARAAAPAPAEPRAEPRAEPPADDAKLVEAPLLRAAARATPGGARATPAARAEARRQAVALHELAGSGRRGRVELPDVLAALASDRPGLSRIAVPGGHISYRSWGEPRPGGTSLMLFHGFAGDAQTWAALASALARGGAHVLAPDLPGHGATDIPADTLDAMTSTLAGLLRAGGRPVHLVGHSLGGALAARVARAVPNLVQRLTLLAPAGLDRGIDAGFIREMARVRSGGALTHLSRRLTVRPTGVSAAQYEAMAAELSRGRLLALADALVDEGGQCVDIIPELRAATMPVRIIWGLQDRIIPWTQASQAGSRAAIHLVPDAGHVPHWDQPAEVAALLT